MAGIKDSLNRREFMKGVAGVGAVLAPAGKALAASGRVPSPNDRINVAHIGIGGRGSDLSSQYWKIGQKTGKCQIVAVCDVWQKRVSEGKKNYQCDGYLDYHEVLGRSDVDAVVIATPDHWHAKIALEAMDHGKDVYLEKPMTHTIEQARQLVEKVKEKKRVLQVGSQTTTADQWHKARQVIADGRIGQMIMSQGSYHRNSNRGEWNWPIDPNAGPEGKGDDYIDWKTWLGPAPQRPWDADRYFRFRKYWDYSGGIATDLFYHVAAPLNICWSQPQFPARVMAGGGNYIFKDGRDVPDTFHLIGEYAAGHSVVLTSSMANSQHIPGLIRGHEGTVVMVESGEFESSTPYIIVRPEKRVISDDYKAKWGADEVKIPVEQVEGEGNDDDPTGKHIENFLDCVRSRQKPTLDVETGARAQVLISMSVQSYREGRVLYFDEASWKVSSTPPAARAAAG
ncbi:MAG: Gfo/Idh/MocA family oxidoreductase [Terriglobia bacterium]